MAVYHPFLLEWAVTGGSDCIACKSAKYLLSCLLQTKFAGTTGIVLNIELFTNETVYCKFPLKEYNVVEGARKMKVIGHVLIILKAMQIHGSEESIIVFLLRMRCLTIHLKISFQKFKIYITLYWRFPIPAQAFL